MSEIPNSMDRRIKKSKAALKDALIHLMQKSPFKEISITDIVQRADLNRGTFYRHYQYKEDLFNEIIDDVIQDLVTSFREPYQGMEEFELGLMPSSAITIFEHVHQHAQFYTLVVKSEASASFQRMICDVLRELSLQDLNPIFPPHINPELLASYQSHAIFGMFWSGSDRNSSTAPPTWQKSCSRSFITNLTMSFSPRKCKTGYNPTADKKTIEPETNLCSIVFDYNPSFCPFSKR